MRNTNIFITSGDPTGIGPEIIQKGWSDILETSNRFGMTPIVFADPDPFVSINKAIDAALSSPNCPIVTCPISKKSLHDHGHFYPGHTEILAQRCGVSDFAMMLYLAPSEKLLSPNGLAVVHVTLHTAMKNIFEQITVQSVLEKSFLINDFMLKINGRQPRIAVCSLNPHAGENGIFGIEEIEIIAPAVKIARQKGLLIDGPFPADTIFQTLVSGGACSFPLVSGGACPRSAPDAVVAMFHDQGHIPLKLLDRNKAVNITLGLPIIRTSVAHGTAHDIAGKNIADPSSLIEAVRIAAILSQNSR